MKTKSTLINRIFIIALFTASSIALKAANYDLRFDVHEYDCQSMHVLVDIEIKATNTSFFLADQNYRFTFNEFALANPTKHSELVISGVVIGDGYQGFYQTHTTTGSTANTVSYNVELTNGDGYLVGQDWVAVGRIRFDVVNSTAPINLNWNHTNNAAPTIITTTAGSIAEGQLDGLIAYERTIDLRVFLEGPYQATKDKMSTFLNLSNGSYEHRGVLPGQAPFSEHTTMTVSGQPYTGSPWMYEGTEGDDVHLYEPSVVDWVLVIFRSGTPGAQTDVWKTSALLHDDGRVELKTAPDFSMLPAQVYIKIVHRNHIPIMTATPIMTDNCGTISYDFTTQDSYKTGTAFGQKELEPDVFAMFAGNSEIDNDAPYYGVNGMDKIVWASTNGYFDEYRVADFNLDSEVNALDKLVWIENNGINSAVKQ